MGVEQQYIELFDSQRDLIDRHSVGVLNARRAAAREAFAAHGLPTRRDERCKYTDVAEAFAPDYGLNLGCRPLSRLSLSGAQFEYSPLLCSQRQFHVPLACCGTAA